MINKITKADVLMMAAQITAGVLANPSTPNPSQDQYMRQNMLQQCIFDVQNAVISCGIQIIEEDVEDE